MANELSYLFPEDLKKRLAAQREPAGAPTQPLVELPFEKTTTTKITEAPELSPEAAANVLQQAAEAKGKTSELYRNTETILKGQLEQAKELEAAERSGSQKRIDEALAAYEKGSDKEMSMSQLFARALIGLAPQLLGAAVGKSMGISIGAGGVAGAQGGLAGLKQLEEAETKARERGDTIAATRFKAQIEREKELLKPFEEATKQAQEELIKLPSQESRVLSTIAAQDPKLALEIAKAQQQKGRTTDITEKGERGVLPKPPKSAGGAPKLGTAEAAVARTLGTQYANRVNAIAEIDSTINTLQDPSISKDQKIVAFQGLYKRLNDPANSDAVQRQEAERLGPFAEFKVLNITGPGPIFGRDMDKALEQLKIARGKISDAAEAARTTVGQIEAGTKIPSVPKPPGQPLTLTKQDYDKMTAEEAKAYKAGSPEQRKELLKKVRAR